MSETKRRPGGHPGMRGRGVPGEKAKDFRGSRGKLIRHCKPVTAEAVEQPEDAVNMLRQEDVDVVLLSCQYRAPEMLRPLVRQMREAAGKPIFVFCMQAGQREEVLDIISACGLDGFVPLPFFLSNLENEMAKLRTEFGNIGNVDGTSVLNGMRLLCAEDNPLNAEILEELLHMQGATCTIYSDGKQLVEAFDHVRPTVVGPAEQPRSPASAISAYMAVPAPGSASAASENVPGQKMPTEKPHSAQPSSAASALPLCDATM